MTVTITFRSACLSPSSSETRGHHAAVRCSSNLFELAARPMPKTDKAAYAPALRINVRRVFTPNGPVDCWLILNMV